MKYKLLFLIVMLSLIPLTSSLELYQTPNQVFRNFDTIYISEAVTNNGTSTYIGNGFIGRIDEVALFSEDLTEEQVLEIYNNGDGLPYGGLGISVILLNPSNNDLLNMNNILFSIDVNKTEEIDIKSIEIKIFDSDNNLVYSNTNSSKKVGVYNWNVNLIDGYYEWYIVGTDEDDETYMSYTNMFNIDSISPQFIINENDVIMDISQNHTIKFEVSDINLEDVWYNYEGVNTTLDNVISDTEYSFNFTINRDDLNLRIYANDSAMNLNYIDVPIILDPTYPTITIQSGEGLQNYGVININHEINFSVEDDNLDKVWYEYNGSNETINNTLIENNGAVNTDGNTNWKLVKNQSVNNYVTETNSTIWLQYSNGGRGGTIRQVIIYEDETNETLEYFRTGNTAEYISQFVNPNPYKKVDRVEVYLKRESSSYWIQTKNLKIQTFSLITFDYPNGFISLPLEKDLYTATIYANDTAGNLQEYQVDWSYKVLENERTYNNETFETKDETFIVNITSDKVSKVWLNYNGLDYETNNINPYNVTINIPPTQTNTNRTFYWKFLYDNSENITSKIDEQLAKTFKLNWTGDKQLIKFEIRDEFDNSLINNTDLRLLGDYYIDGNGYTKILDEFKTADGSYDFKSTPNVESVRIQGEAFYQAVGYQPRYYFFDDEVFTNSSLTTKTFYLSLYTDGILVRYKIVDSAANPIEGVRITAKKIVGQQKILVEQVLTDGEGEASLFLDPNYYHDIIIEKETCQTITKNRRVTSSEQTMEVLNCNLEPDEPSIPLITFNKVSFKFLPNTIPANAQGNYALSLETKDKNCELTKSEFELTYNGNVLDTQTKLNDCGDTFNSIVNTSTINGYLVVKGTVWKDDLSMTESKSYYIYDDSSLIFNDTSIQDVLDNFKNNTFGDKLGLSEKSRILITFLILFGIISALSINDRGMKDSVPIILIASNLYLWAMSYIGFLTLPADLVSIKVIQQYGIAVLTSILSFFGYHIGKGR